MNNTVTEPNLLRPQKGLHPSLYHFWRLVAGRSFHRPNVPWRAHLSSPCLCRVDAFNAYRVNTDTSSPCPPPADPPPPPGPSHPELAAWIPATTPNNSDLQIISPLYAGFNCADILVPAFQKLRFARALFWPFHPALVDPGLGGANNYWYHD